MPRPTSKSDLYQANAAAYEELTALLGVFSVDELNGSFSFAHRDRCVRDVLAHLHEWHLLFLNWYKVGMSGEKPVMPTVGFTWRTTPELNQTIQTKYQSTSLKSVRSMLARSHKRIQQIVDDHSNDELFEKRRYRWTGSTSLGSYITSAMASHYS